MLLTDVTGTVSVIYAVSVQSIDNMCQYNIIVYMKSEYSKSVLNTKFNIHIKRYCVLSQYLKRQ